MPHYLGTRVTRVVLKKKYSTTRVFKSRVIWKHYDQHCYCHQSLFVAQLLAFGANVCWPIKQVSSAW